MRNSLSIYVIYEKPKDFPDHFVVRVQYVTGGPIRFDPNCTLHDSLEAARSVIPAGLVCFARDEGDDPVIVESWL